MPANCTNIFLFYAEIIKFGLILPHLKLFGRGQENTFGGKCPMLPCDTTGYKCMQFVWCKGLNTDTHIKLLSGTHNRNLPSPPTIWGWMWLDPRRLLKCQINCHDSQNGSCSCKRQVSLYILHGLNIVVNNNKAKIFYVSKLVTNWKTM